jgi:hypothetical protein
MSNYAMKIDFHAVVETLGLNETPYRTTKNGLESRKQAVT